MQLIGANYGYLYQTTLEDSLRNLASHGFKAFELTPVPPHLYTPTYGSFERRQLKRLLRKLNLMCSSVNPSYTDLNVISTNSEFRELTYRQLVQNMELAYDLEARFLVVIPGRRNALIPTPDEDALPVFKEQLAKLLEHAQRLGLIVSIENSPYGFLQKAEEMAAVADELNHPMLRLTYDVANGFMNEDPAKGAHTVAKYLGLAHVSDTWKHRWAHTQVGKGEVDFAAFARALRAAGFSGQTVYELVDGLDPDPRLAGDLRTFGEYGWTV